MEYEEYKTILDLNSREAKDFFLRNESFCNIKLPMYFNFEPLLKSLSLLKGSTIQEAVKRMADYDQDKINCIVYTNKDSRYSWRPLQIINPVAYTHFVNIITQRNYWKEIVERLRLFQHDKNIICCSMPVVSDSENVVINQWHERFEKETIKKSLDYKYMIKTDISNCYGAIYSHSIAWALYPGFREEAKKDALSRKKLPKNIANRIDWAIQDISNKQTNGIPQGSVLMDFIAEIVLGYGDYLLSERIKSDCRINNETYCILRFRDDYRILTKNKNEAELIARYLSEVLQELTLRLNEQKTVMTDDIISDSQKEDKLACRNMKKCEGLEEGILQIHAFSEKYPNSGSLKKMLEEYCSDFDNMASTKNDLKLIASVIADIACKNHKTYQYAISILGRIDTLLDEDGAKKLLKSVMAKMDEVTRPDLLYIWIQRLSKRKNFDNYCKGSICKYIKEYIDKNEIYPELLWTIDMLNDEQKEKLRTIPIINRIKFDDMREYPEMDEIELLFEDY